MKARTRFMAGGTRVLGSAGYLMASSIESTAMSDATPSELVYRGLIPDTFTDSVDVVLEGRLGRDGAFRATTLLAKCASRYENAPDRYRSAPGCWAAQARRP